MFRNIFYTSVKRIISGEQTTSKPLGRWALDSHKKKEIKGILANIDSCGDNNCGDVNTIRKAINYIEKTDEKTDDK